MPVDRDLWAYISTHVEHFFGIHYPPLLEHKKLQTRSMKNTSPEQDPSTAWRTPYHSLSTSLLHIQPCILKNTLGRLTMCLERAHFIRNFCVRTMRQIWYNLGKILLKRLIRSSEKILGIAKVLFQTRLLPRHQVLRLWSGNSSESFAMLSSSLKIRRE